MERNLSTFKEAERLYSKIVEEGKYEIDEYLIDYSGSSRN